LAWQSVGYESRTNEELARDLTQDLRSFVESVSRNPVRVRMVDRNKGKGVLEWQVGGAWKAAVPADGGTWTAQGKSDAGAP
jgi:hypothetical protein